ncbi:MAG: bifunctional phosphopantothenoylcysteine decarboxylase/phosphopantothenate--cysteine ligase CoaBC [Streptosporangiales bacterium]
MAKTVVGVAGGIAAYKTCALVRLLAEAGHEVRVVPTQGALEFVGSATWEALSGRPVTSRVWDDAYEVPHVRLGREADLLVVAPATANLLARAAHGLADDLLTSTLLTARCPVVLAPAMHTEMWEHPATRANVATLRERGVLVLEPANGRLTGADNGPGRMPEAEEIHVYATWALERHRPAARDLAGRRVLVSAGGTREPLDPVRFLGNRSSGRQGYALARTALARGAQVVLVAANTALPDPAGVQVVRVGTTGELRDAVSARAAEVDAVVMAAAPADFKPATSAPQKIKKTGGDPEPVRLVHTADVLAELGSTRPRAGQVIVGFAAETENVLEGGRAKLAKKGADLLVVNQVGDGLGFESDRNAATVLGADGTAVEVPEASKAMLADRVWDLIAARLG